MIERRKRLKRHQTLQERIFKAALDELKIVHRVQYLITLHSFDKSYILDFYLPDYKIAFEIDGESHRTNDGKTYDMVREQRLRDILGIKIIRFENEQIHNPMMTIHMIQKALKGNPRYFEIPHTKVKHRINTLIPRSWDYKRYAKVFDC